jgi:hypothetical protein
MNLSRNDFETLAPRGVLAGLAAGDPAVLARPTVQEFRLPPTRSLRAIRDALDDALARSATGSELMRALLVRRGSIDPDAASLVLRCMTALLAASSGETPGGVLRSEAVLAPSDSYWDADLSDPVEAHRVLDTAC